MSGHVCAIVSGDAHSALKSTAKGEHNAFASYAILTRQGAKPTDTEIAARKQEVHSLYEQRVLGRQQS